uniref:Tetratricopeptide TPR_2 repeat protein n=1 Tax=Nostoc flagelliforme str. Sunitezuoqi TaxID=676037 RepID=E7DQ37_9NOSO|nr:tetratricopeptide TPR_2 repeat protein [Nostoc flagelliforme str. Sunitezuoqi]
METVNLEQAQVSYNQGLAHLKSGNLDAVIECFREALLLNPNFAEVHNTIGLIQFQIEKVATYQEWLQILSNNLNPSSYS